MAGYSTPAWTNNAAPAIDATALTNIGHGIEIAEHPFGVCSTASSTAAKTVTVDFSGTLSLFTGLTVVVQFTHRNTATSPTLNVNGTGAVAINASDSVEAKTNAWLDGEIVTFTYDGTRWCMQNGSSKTSIIYFSGLTVNAANNAQILRVPASGTNPNITTDTVVLNCMFTNPSFIASAVSWQSYDGYVVFTGTTYSATTANVTLGRKAN